MGFWNKQNEITVPEIRSVESYNNATGLNYNSMSAFSTNNYSAMNLSAVYACVTALSNGVATLPLNVFETDADGFKSTIEHPITSLVNKQPSTNFSSFDFWKLTVSSVLLRGQSFAIINRDRKNVITGLRYINKNRVTVLYDYQTDVLTYRIAGFDKLFKSTDVLDFKMYFDELTMQGISTITHAFQTLNGASDAENHSVNFFKSGAASSGILKVNAKLDAKQIEAIRQTWQSAFNSTTSSGVAILEGGAEYLPITINSKDAQLLESRSFNVEEICRFFNVSPVKIQHLVHSSYSTLESVQLSFLEDSLKPWLSMIEAELNRKLFNNIEQNFLEVKFDATSMLNTDKQATAEYYKQMIVNGVMSVNEVRRALNLNSIDNGNENYLQLNMSTLTNINNNTVNDDQKKLAQQISIKK